MIRLNLWVQLVAGMSFGSSGNESCHFQASDHGWDVQSLSYTQSNHDRSQQMHSNDAEISVKEMYLEKLRNC